MQFPPRHGKLGQILEAVSAQTALDPTGLVTMCIGSGMGINDDHRGTKLLRVPRFWIDIRPAVDESEDLSRFTGFREVVVRQSRSMNFGSEPSDRGLHL
jgi:hypothetical protein